MVRAPGEIRPLWFKPFKIQYICMEIRPVYSSMEAHNYLLRIDNYVARKSLCDADADLIRKFISYKLAADSISSKRTLKLAGTLCLWRTKFLNCGFADVTDSLWLTSAAIIRSAELKQNTMRDYLLVSRSFLLWLQEEGLNKNLTMSGIMKVRLPGVQKITKTPDMLLTDDEVLTMLHHPQCKPVTAALIAILYYTGMRPSEALTLRWRDLEFTSQLLKIRITDSKTGKFRYAPCSEAIEYVAYWRNHYPDEISGGPEGDNPVFVCRVNSKSQPGRPYGSLGWAAARKQISILSTVSIGRKVNLYVFRGSDITNSAVKGVPDSVNKAIHWGNQSTNMLSTYLLLKDSQIDTALLKRAGVEVQEEAAENKTKNLLCQKCYTMNAAGSEYCKACGEPLSRAAINKRLEEREISRKQQEIKSMISMLNDVADVFNMSYEEFTAKLLNVKQK